MLHAAAPIDRADPDCNSTVSELGQTPSRSRDRDRNEGTRAHILRKLTHTHTTLPVPPCLLYSTHAQSGYQSATICMNRLFWRAGARARVNERRRIKLWYPGIPAINLSKSILYMLL